MPSVQKYLKFLEQHQKTIFLILTVIGGILILSPFVDFQEWLSQGDHGRDLYAFDQAYRGKLPYIDYWWVYGPLMPYYYGLFLKLFGTNIVSVLLGRMVLKLVAGIFLYLAGCAVLSPAVAFLAAVWFWHYFPDFFFTYSHTGGITMVLAILYCMFGYLKTLRSSYLFGALGAVFTLTLIKVNFGFAALWVLLLATMLIDAAYAIGPSRDKKIFYILAFIAVPLVSIAIYAALLGQLPMYAIRQCMPYSNADQPYNTTPWAAIKIYAQTVFHNMNSGWPNRVMSFIVVLSLFQMAFAFATKTFDAKNRKPMLLAVAILCIFFVANAHEFLKSGVWYRGFWAQPISMFLMFTVLYAASRSLHRAVRALLWIAIGLIVGTSVVATSQMIHRACTPDNYLAMDRAKIFVGNYPDWIYTVKTTTSELEKRLKPGETFFALPYDCLYYFLTGRTSPTRQLIFFEHINIPPEQERLIIKELEAKKINTIVVSSRFKAHAEAGLGVLGTTYCPLLGDYINKNFGLVAKIGNWEGEPGWAWNHGTMILERFRPL